MAYRYNRYRNRRSFGGYSTPSTKKSRLSGKIGYVWQDILKDFFSLSKSNLESLFSRYEEEYGANAAKYARAAYPKWKSGATKTSGQTIERLVNLVPRYLSTTRRLELLNKVVDYNDRKRGGKKDYRIRINVKSPAEGLRLLTEALDELAPQDILATIPKEVFSVAEWLYDDDITAFRGLIAQSRSTEYSISRTNAENTVRTINQTIANSRSDENTFTDANYSVSFPTGNLSVTVFKHIPRQRSQTAASDCFVATEVYGDPDNHNVKYLRYFRDSYLSNKAAGRCFIAWYYSNGPRLASALHNQKLIKYILKLVLSTTVFILKSINNDER